MTHAWVGRCGVGTIEAWLSSMRTQRFTWVGTACGWPCPPSPTREYRAPHTFLTKETAQAIIDGGDKKVVSVAPAKDNFQVVVKGASANKDDGSNHFVLCASCTTNGLGHMAGRVGKPHSVEPVC